MLVLGVDPGLATLGYGVVEERGGRLEVLDYGVLTTPADTPLPQRLESIYDGLTAIIRRYPLDSIAVEELFFARNIKTAISVAQARGVALLAAARSGVSVVEFTPLQVKQAVVGQGKAEKIQIQAMVRIILGLPEIPKPDDAADALAVAICGAHSAKLSGYQKENRIPARNPHR
ncbi:MAG: crossover junction endodeoxyribonuclease RuvC [bacterium]